MKKIFLALCFLISINAISQDIVFPVNSTNGSKKSTVLTLGVSAADSGFHLRTNYADTFTLNIGLIKYVPGIVVRVGSEIYIRNADATEWVTQIQSQLKIDQAGANFRISGRGHASGGLSLGTYAATTTALDVQSLNNTSTTKVFNFKNNAGTVLSYLQENGIFSINKLSALNSTGRLQVQGTGTSAASYVANFYNSLGTQVFGFSNGATLEFGVGNEFNATGNNQVQLQYYAGAQTASGTVRSHLFESASTKTSGIVQLLTLGTANPVNYNFNVSSGNAEFRSLSIQPNIQQAGSATGTVRGIYYNPIATVSGTHIAFENTVGQLRFGGVERNDTLSKVLVTDYGNNQVWWRDASTLGGGGSAGLADTAAAIRAAFPNTYAGLTTSIVDVDTRYSGFPWPIQKADTTMVFYKNSTTHADTGSIRFYKSANGGRSWSSGEDVYINGRRIPNSALQVGYNNSRIQLAWTEDTYDSVFFAYSDNGGASWTSAGGYKYSNNWTGSPSIQEIFKIKSDTLYSAQYELDNDSDSTRAFLLYSADNGASWSYLREVLLHTGTTFPNGKISEWFMVQTSEGTFDNTTQFAALFRNESYGYYTHVRTANLFQAKTEDVTNLMYEFGNQVQRAPVCMFNMQGTIYILCGNRRSNNLFALEYVTISASSFYTNTQSGYSKVRKLYAATAATKAAAEDFGYPLVYVYNQKPYVTFYDVSPVYHSSGEGGDDDVRSINFPLLDRGYSEKFNDANQSITDSTQTLVSYPDLLLDCMGSWDYDGEAGTTDSVWEAKEDGWYMFWGTATFEANSTGSYRQMYIVVVDPGVNTTATNQLVSKTTIPGHGSNSDFNRVECNGMAYVKQGEQVKVFVKHDATTPLNLLNTSRETMATIKITLVR